MKKINKILLMIVFIILLGLIGIPTKVEARTMEKRTLNNNNELTINYADLEYSTNVYCVAHAKGWVKRNGADQPFDRVTFKAMASVTIQGKVANGTNKNGTKIGPIENDDNALMASILGGSLKKGFNNPKGSYSPAQQALYSVWNNWVDNVGGRYGFTKDSANDKAANTPARINRLKTALVTAKREAAEKDYTVTIYWLHPQSNANNVQELILVEIGTPTEKTKEGNLNIKKVDSDDNSIVLPSVEFVIKSTYKNKYIKIKTKKDDTTWSTRLIGNVNVADLEYTAVRDEATRFVTNKNGLIGLKNLPACIKGTDIKYTAIEVKNPNSGYTKMERETIDTDKVLNGETVQIENEKTKGQLNIEKVDSDDTDTVLPNVEFVIKSSYKNNQYIRIKKNAADKEWTTRVSGTTNVAAIGYTSNESNATVFVTNSKGRICLKNISARIGESDVKYTVEEIKNPNSGYEVKADQTTINTDKILDGETIQIKNKKTKGELNIEKVDSQNTDDKLANVEFVIKSSYNDKYIKIKATEGNIEPDKNGWATRIIGGSTVTEIGYTDVEDDATKFVTNSSGRISIRKLVVRIENKNITYTAKEIKNPGYGYTKMETKAIGASKILNGETVQITNEIKLGKLDIEKVDESGNPLAKVEFVIKSSLHKQYIKVKAEDGNVTNDNKGWATRILGSSTITDIEYTSEKDEATRFVTNANGKIIVRDLLISSNGKDEIKYNIVETSNPNPLYNSKYESGYISLGTDTIKIENRQEYINIEGCVWEEISTSKDNSVDKIYTSKDALIEGIKVRLYKDSKRIKTLTTDSNGKYKFEKVKIDELDKYYIEFEYDGLRFKPVDVDTEYSGKNYNISSKAQEVPSGRDDRKDRQSVNEDFSEITNGKSRNNGEEVYKLNYGFANHVSTYTDHWKYEYKDNKTVLTVKPSDDYAIIASTQKSKFDLKKAYNEQKAKETLTGINLGIQRREQADLAISTDIESMNIVVRNYENKYTYGKRKEYENQSPNSTNYNAEKDGFGVDVKFGNKYGTSYSNRGLKTYTRRIYESDLVVYDKNYDKSKNLVKIYVTYKITIKNQASKVRAVVNELSNYYDSRYTIEESWIMNGNKRTDIDANEWSEKSKYGTSYNENGYKAIYTQAASDIEILANGKIDIYIKFRLQPEAVRALMEQQTTLNNISEITSFSTKTFNSSQNKSVPYAAIDEDSNPGSLKIEFIKDTPIKTTLNKREYTIETKTLKETSYEDDTGAAPSLVLGIEESNPTRGLSGTVFEDEDALHKDDTTHVGEERIGDGILHTGGTYRGKGANAKIDTNRVSGVKVELLQYDKNSSDHIAKDTNGNDKIAILYKLKVDESGNLTTTTEKAITTTNSKGEYVFTGVAPGRYLIRYTYDSKCYITDSAGKQIEQLKVGDYKSTIITSDLINAALNLNDKENEREGDLNWILRYDNVPSNNNYTTDAKNKSKNLNGLIRYSSAIDDVKKRTSMDDIYYGSSENTSNMIADTAFFDVGVEFSEIKEENGFTNKMSYTDYKDEYQLKDNKIIVLDEKGKLKIVDTFYAVNPYQDFGIIERARQDYEINKKISNLKVTLASGQVIINGNGYKQLPENTNVDEYWNNIESPSDSPLPYTKALPGQVVAEIDNEILQGATLNVEYTISIRNKSEKDYKYTENQDYYYYGKNGNGEIGTVIRKIVDYMEDDLVYDDQQNTNIGWTKVQASDLYKWTKDSDNNNKQLISKDVMDAVKQGYTIAVTEYFNQQVNEIAVGKIGSVKLYGSKLISTSEKGIDVKNHAEIIETMGMRAIKGATPGNYNPKTRTPNEPDSDMTSLVITPPTGLTENKTVIVVTIVISMIVLAGGIYLIKRKVL